MPRRSEKIVTINGSKLSSKVYTLYEIKFMVDCRSARFIPRSNNDEWIILRRTSKSHFFIEINNKATRISIPFGSYDAINDFLEKRYSEQMKLA